MIGKQEIRRSSQIVFLLAEIFVLGCAGETAQTPPTISGEIVESRSTWSSNRAAIITVHTVRMSNGGETNVWQPGGVVSGIRMSTTDAVPGLALGDQIDVGASEFGQVIDVYSLIPAVQKTERKYVPSNNAVGHPLFWVSRDIAIVYATDGVSTLPGDDEFDELDAAFSSWQTASIDCGATDNGTPVPLYTFDTTGRQNIEVGNDGVNLVKFRETTWCRPIGGGMEQCYNPSLAGLTTIFSIDDDQSAENGKILDVDIEVNGVNFVVWRDGDPSASPGCGSDLRNNMTHEIGHLLALSHTCWDGTGTRPNDGDGDPIPNCAPSSGLGAEITEATMYNFQDCEETKKRTLEPDDILGMCEMAGLLCDAGPPIMCSSNNECMDGGANCSPFAICTDTVQGFVCTCIEGYEGDGVTCVDTNECSQSTDNCDEYATCANTDGSFSCTCIPGTIGTGVACTDVNECADGSHDCNENAACSNTIGGFTCECKSGYSGDGVNCSAGGVNSEGSEGAGCSAIEPTMGGWCLLLSLFALMCKRRLLRVRQES